jgi:hypothetical protein
MVTARADAVLTTIPQAEALGAQAAAALCDAGARVHVAEPSPPDA